MPDLNTPSSLPRLADHGLLSLMAMFEDNFSVDWILEMSGLKASEILQELDKLFERKILQKEGPGVYSFRNEAQRKKIAQSVPQAEKELWHRSIAGIYFREMQSQDEAVLAASSHLIHLKNGEQECKVLMKAGDIYRKTHRHQKALQCYQKIIDDLEMAASTQAYQLFTNAVIAVSKIVELAPDVEATVPPLKTAVQKARDRKDDAHTALLEMHLAKNEWFCSHFNQAMRHFNRGWALAEKIDDPALKRSAVFLSTFFLYAQGRLREVIRNYEEVVSDIDKYPRGRFPMLSAQVVGVCYAFNGQIKRGMGLMDAIYEKCRSVGDLYVGSYVGYHIGSLLIELGQYEEAIYYLDLALDHALQTNNTYNSILISLNLALAHFRNHNQKEAVSYLSEAVRVTRERGIKIETHIYQNAEMFWAMEQGQLPAVQAALAMEDLKEWQKSRNILIKGGAYRYQALLEEKRGVETSKVLRSMKLSEKWLEESGHEIQLARTRMEMARLYLSMGQEKKAKGAMQKSAELLDSFLHDQVPDNLRFLLKDLRTDKNLLEEIMKLGQELATIRNDRDLVRHILATVNRITGAERGAVFLVNKETGKPAVVLRAARNIMEQDISRPEFQSSMKMVREAAFTGRARFRLTEAPRQSHPLENKVVHSCICVPMKFRETVLGVLYVDNRIFPSALKESDIRILDFFSSQAAIALDNARIHEQNRALIRKLEEEKRYLEEQQSEFQPPVEFVGECSAVRKVLNDVKKIAATDSTVLILGETGVGKELISTAIHERSSRAGKPFIRVNCSMFPEGLIASELFGHEKGAFTGADKRRLGRFELADGGTLFLDEIGDISHEVQVRLLRVLQNKEFERVGGRTTLRSDFRLLAATNRDLREDVKTGRFREDLYYRLNVLSLKIPPLRERKEDIPLLVDYFLDRHAKNLGKPRGAVTPEDLDKLVAYDWPGNVRELENVIERSAILSSGARLEIPDLSQSGASFALDRDAVSLEENERRHILWALKKTGGKVRGPGGAAELLEINHNTLFSRIKKLGIKRK
ncbi:Transcriptional regulator containing GAF, AAA-type ATPase, and DNA-binding Fis domains [Desulfatibacillum alkenivorans DSM 16219]|jgi:transcriptional regulator with GAF, ATPase, and Fis domain|uniref:Transcriptional regulator containing GAF, AAA-type ATPase, and DNA-binding Fis domains n=1 Tax=Desulfatibacillum alkenivorans DSM 16219 TaxID=1121393 RepID=A0A1M6F5F5_9BACT|nr:sigma 54-interacting transcriptional regulator [Desulfatibacillum alkenivorans]SHI92935.1 Transcriptional regulator containing GAF, AAA-type ATPase, and DNA-binding Fis domains [Desulfatibacillum alkenivorans DSM 16219]